MAKNYRRGSVESTKQRLLDNLRKCLQSCKRQRIIDNHELGGGELWQLALECMIC